MPFRKALATLSNQYHFILCHTRRRQEQLNLGGVRGPLHPRVVGGVSKVTVRWWRNQLNLYICFLMTSGRCTASSATFGITDRFIGFFLEMS